MYVASADMVQKALLGGFKALIVDKHFPED